MGPLFDYRETKEEWIEMAKTKGKTSASAE